MHAIKSWGSRVEVRNWQVMWVGYERICKNFDGDLEHVEHYNYYCTARSWWERNGNEDIEKGLRSDGRIWCYRW